jgi:hypothetical protein
MYLVAIAWMYVVLMMSLAEALSSQGTVLGAFITLVLYGLLPLSILLYIMGTPLRRRRALREAAGDSPLQKNDGGHAPRDGVPPEGKEV